MKYSSIFKRKADGEEPEDPSEPEGSVEPSESVETEPVETEPAEAEPTTPDSDNPKAGDNSIVILLAVMLISCGGIVVTLANKRKIF